MSERARVLARRAGLDAATAALILTAGEVAMSHYAQVVVELTILALAIFLGIEVISKVPTLLHTPLMSGTNAIQAIVIVGALSSPASPRPDLLTGWIGLRRHDLAAANVVGGSSSPTGCSRCSSGVSPQAREGRAAGVSR